jgi:hypothetical protein
MKSLFIGSFIGIVCMTKAFAGYVMIGETRDCPIQTKIIQKMAAKEDSLLVIHESDIFELKMINQVGSTKYYASSSLGIYQQFPMTFEATIMGEEMSVLSRLKIYLSGVMVECVIDR